MEPIGYILQKLVRNTVICAPKVASSDEQPLANQPNDRAGN